jgi:protein phosphatase
MSELFPTLRRLMFGGRPRREPANEPDHAVSEHEETSAAPVAVYEDTTLPMTSDNLTVDAFGATDVGKKRDRNEDQFLIAELSKSMLVHLTSLPHADHQRLVGGAQGKLFIVADGMGGHGGGRVASTVAVDSIVQYALNIMPWFFGLNDSQEEDLMDELKAALQRCQRSVKHAAEGETEHSRMGTTLTMAYVLWPRLYVVHAGDSRCYLGRGPELEQITRDHTLAQQLVEQKVMSTEKAEKSKWSSVLWNAIGGGKDELWPEVYRSDLKRGDTLLLCTDGLTKHLDEQAISRELKARPSSAQTATESLIERANREGGKDNVTVVVARFQ